MQSDGHPNGSSPLHRPRSNSLPANSPIKQTPPAEEPTAGSPLQGWAKFSPDKMAKQSPKKNWCASEYKRPTVVIKQYRPKPKRYRPRIENPEDRELTFRPKINPWYAPSIDTVRGRLAFINDCCIVVGAPGHPTASALATTNRLPFGWKRMCLDVTPNERRERWHGSSSKSSRNGVETIQPGGCHRDRWSTKARSGFCGEMDFGTNQPSDVLKGYRQERATERKARRR